MRSILGSKCGKFLASSLVKIKQGTVVHNIRQIGT